MKKLGLILVGALILVACGEVKFDPNSAVNVASVAPGESAGGNGDSDRHSPGEPKKPVSDVVANPGLLNQYPCEAGSDKVKICHIPPGNPCAKHTLCIGRPAVSAHLDHHVAKDDEKDYLGDCRDDQNSGGDEQSSSGDQNNSGDSQPPSNF